MKIIETKNKPRTILIGDFLKPIIHPLEYSKVQRFLQMQLNFQKLLFHLEIAKDNSVALEHLGDVLMKDNKQKEAINYYKRALALDKDNPILIKKASLE